MLVERRTCMSLDTLAQMEG